MFDLFNYQRINTVGDRVDKNEVNIITSKVHEASEKISNSVLYSLLFDINVYIDRPFILSEYEVSKKTKRISPDLREYLDKKISEKCKIFYEYQRSSVSETLDDLKKKVDENFPESVKEKISKSLLEYSKKEDEFVKNIVLFNIALVFEDIDIIKETSPYVYRTERFVEDFIAEIKGYAEEYYKEQVQKDPASAFMSAFFGTPIFNKKDGE